ncbi:MAG: energy transducer TonB, partial [Nostocales cyanobacterium]
TPRSFTKPEPISTPVVNTIPESKPEITPRSFTTPKPISTPVVNTIPQTNTTRISTSAPMKSENLEKLRNSLAKAPNTSSNSLINSRKLIPGDNQNNLNNLGNNDNLNPSNSSNNPPSNNTNSRTPRNTFPSENNNNNTTKTALTPQTSNSGDGRASCVQCGSSYPSWARRRGVQGRVVVAVDTDSAGNVINVQLVSSSGSSRLDKEHIQMVRGWKLKPSENGRTGVTISTDYILR